MWVEIGLQLKQAREALGLSFDELQDKTRVPKSYLQALEKGEFNKLPSPFYVRSYLRAFAEQVGLEPTTLLRKYRLSTTGNTATVSTASDQNNQGKPVGQATGHMPQIRDSQTGHLPQVTGRMQQMTGHLPQVSGRVRQTTGYLPQVTGRHLSQKAQQTMQMPALLGRAVHEDGQTSQGGVRVERHSGRYQKIDRHGDSASRDTGIYATQRISKQATGQHGLGTLGEQSAANQPRGLGSTSGMQQDSKEFETKSLPARSSKRNKGDLTTTESRLSRLEVAAAQESAPDALKDQQSSFLPAPVETGLSRRNSSRHRKIQSGGKKGPISRKMLSWVAAAAVLIPVGVWGGSTIFGDKPASETAPSQENQVVKEDSDKEPGQPELSSKQPKVKLISEKSGVASYQLIEPGEIVVEISPTGVCWVQIQDGNKNVVKDDTLRAGYKPIIYQHSQDMDSDLVIVLGAPENVKVKLNGQSVKATQKIHISQQK